MGSVFLFSLGINKYGTGFGVQDFLFTVQSVVAGKRITDGNRQKEEKTSLSAK